MTSADIQPAALEPLVIDLPAGRAKERGDPAVAVATVALGQLDDIGGQGRFVVGRPWRLALGRAVLAEHPAGPSLGYPELTADLLDAPPAPGGPQTFPRASSSRIALSSTRSATSFFSRAFSFFKTLIRRA